MSFSAAETREALAIAVEVGEDTLAVELADGRTIAVPLDWYPRLAHASAAERGSWRLLGGGRGIHWPALDEDISVANLIAGQPSAESQSSFKKWLAGRTKPGRGRRKRAGTEPDAGAKKGTQLFDLTVGGVVMIGTKKLSTIQEEIEKALASPAEDPIQCLERQIASAQHQGSRTEVLEGLKRFLEAPRKRKHRKHRLGAKKE